MCSWIIKNPANMGPKDWMWLQISLLENAEVYVGRAYNYVYDGRPLSFVGSGKKYGMLRGKDFLVTGIGNS